VSAGVWAVTGKPWGCLKPREFLLHSRRTVPLTSHLQSHSCPPPSLVASERARTSPQPTSPHTHRQLPAACSQPVPAATMRLLVLAAAAALLLSAAAVALAAVEPEDDGTPQWLYQLYGRAFRPSGAQAQAQASSSGSTYAQASASSQASVSAFQGPNIVFVGPAGCAQLPPAAPANLKATAGDGTVILTWDKPSNGESCVELCPGDV
jgi:hypothetical protein